LYVKILKMTKIVFYTLGCKANQYQTDILKSQLLTNDAQLTTFGAEADLYVINTCTVTEDADRKSKQAIRRALRLGKRVMVSGCYSKLKSNELKTLFPAIEIKNVDFLASPSFFDCRVRANLMIQDGCDHFCSYCIVPYARGKTRSKPIEEVINEARQLVSTGAKEIVLTGINLATYQPDLSLVIKRLSSLEGLLRIRLSSLEPMYLSKNLIDTIADTPKVCHHLHLPLQSGDNEILKAMNRNYTREDYLELIHYLRKKIPDCGITTDIIVGFPGEGEKEFQNTVDLIRQVKFSRMHIFTYSQRAKTPAANFPKQVREEIKKERSKILHKLREKYMIEFAHRYYNNEVEILVEKVGEGLTSNYIRVTYPGKISEVGKLKKVKLLNNFKDNISEK
ncbi:MAG: MiaB/RimO family radical SAM methylthiotransferase, partial [Candidatus Margulisiibacteriota bacterium]